MADTPYKYSGSADKESKLDQDVRSSTKSLETSASLEPKEPKQRGCCCKCMNCFFCYLPWIPIILCAICLAASIIGLATIRQAAVDTRSLIDDLGFQDNAIVTRVLRAVPVAVWISLIIMGATVIAIFLLAILRSNQRAIHKGIYKGGCCEKSCCYWGLILPSWIVTAIWWLLLVLVVILLIALTLWLATFTAVHYASGFAIDKSAVVSNKLNAKTLGLITSMQDFTDKQNKTMQVVLARTPEVLRTWNQITYPFSNANFTPGYCNDGCLDVAMFQDVLGSKKCICAEDSLRPLESKSIKIARTLYVAFISAFILYLAASLLLVNLTQGNTNAFRDKEELKRLQAEFKAQKAQGGQFIQAPEATYTQSPDLEQAQR